MIDSAADSDSLYLTDLEACQPACALSMSLLPRHVSPEDYRRKAAALYAAGVESFFFWDSAGPSGRANFSPSWEALRRLGHREEVEEWVKAGYPALMREPVPVGRRADYALPYQTPG